MRDLIRVISWGIVVLSFAAGMLITSIAIIERKNRPNYPLIAAVVSAEDSPTVQFAENFDPNRYYGYQPNPSEAIDGGYWIMLPKGFQYANGSPGAKGSFLKRWNGSELE